MTRAQTAEAAKVMKAWADGAAVQWRRRVGGKGSQYCGEGSWKDYCPIGTESVSWDWWEQEWRIKPARRTVPWTAETFPKDRPVWVKSKNMQKCNAAHLVTWYNEYGVDFGELGTSRMWKYLLKQFVQHTGEPCGTVEDGQ